MASRNFYISILLRVLFLAITSLLAGWLIFDLHDYVSAGLAGLLLILEVVGLTRFLNRTNRKIAYFFEAISNNDTSLDFSADAGNRSLRELNRMLARVNQSLTRIRMEMEEQERHFKTILENANIGIITLNEQGTIYLSNRAAERLLNHPHLSHINQIRHVDPKLFSILKDLRPGDRRMVNYRSGTGMMNISLTSTRLKTSKGQFQLVAIQDIRSEMESREAESWIRLIRVLMHEIMNRIAPMTSLSATLLDFYRDSPTSRPSEKTIGNTIEGLKLINEHGTDLLGFVESYRKLTRIPPPEKAMIRLAQLFESTIALVKTGLPDGKVALTWQVQPEGLEVLADKKLMVQVLINLLNNSLDATRNREDARISLLALRGDEGRIRILVTDNGAGVPDQLLDKVFMPFFTTKESGSGIGLSLSRQIMIMHGGTLDLLSAPGKPTQAILEL